MMVELYLITKTNKKGFVFSFLLKKMYTSIINCYYSFWWCPRFDLPLAICMYTSHVMPLLVVFIFYF